MVGQLCEYGIGICDDCVVVFVECIVQICECVDVEVDLYGIVEVLVVYVVVFG